jgi:hypothetical protein
MKSNRQKREELKQRRALKQLSQQELQLRHDLKSKRAIPVDRSKIISRSALPRIPTHYRDIRFTCKDCGAAEIWTATRQKWWYEKAQGEIESVATRCRKCRQIEQKRKEQVRGIHLDGLAKKRLTKMSNNA